MPDKYSASVVEAVLRDGGNAVDAAVAAGARFWVQAAEAHNLPFFSVVSLLVTLGYTTLLAVVAPAKTPPAVVERMNREVKAVLADTKPHYHFLGGFG